MRALVCLLPALLLGASPPQTPKTVSLGAFQTWGMHPRTPLSFAAGGLTVNVVASPCQLPAQNEACRFEGVSNQAIVTVAQPGLPTFRMISDSEASFVRVAVVRLAPKPGRLGVVIDNQWGGSAGITAVTVIEPALGGYRTVPLEYHGSSRLTGEVAVLPHGLLKHGHAGFVLEAPGLNYSNECNACVPRPPLVLTVRNGRSIDISAARAVRPLFEHDLPAHRRLCISTIRERNGSCAAFVADAARLGRAAPAWRLMLSHYRRELIGYPAALRSFLVVGGYITPAAARSLPLT